MNTKTQSVNQSAKVNYHNKTIVFFDGVCGLCNRFVDFALKLDKNNVLLFSPLQGETYQSLNKQPNTKDSFDSIVLYKSGRYHDFSNAVIEIMRSIGGIWKVAVVFYILPPFIRNAAYKFIASNRYKWFGKSETCRIPSAEERAKFLP